MDAFWLRHSVRAAPLALFFGAARLRAQSCDLLVAALTSMGADSARTILDHTVLGVPTFEFYAYSSLLRGDTAIARVLMPNLDSLNRTRRPIPTCLTAERHWRAGEARRGANLGLLRVAL